MIRLARTLAVPTLDTLVRGEILDRGEPEGLD